MQGSIERYQNIKTYPMTEDGGHEVTRYLFFPSSGGKNAGHILRALCFQLSAQIKNTDNQYASNT
jgi:hypothetical protein